MPVLGAQFVRRRRHCPRTSSLSVVSRPARLTLLRVLRWRVLGGHVPSAHIAEFSLPSSLQDLDLSANVLADVGATVGALASLRHLTALVMANNPVAAYPRYRETMLAAVPTLTSIDHRCV